MAQSQAVERNACGRMSDAPASSGKLLRSGANQMLLQASEARKAENHPLDLRTTSTTLLS